MQQWRAVNVLICFYSRYGNTADLAAAVGEGAQISPQDQVWIRRVPDLEPEDAIKQDPRWWQARETMRAKYTEPTAVDVQRADALVLGSPGYFGNMAAALKHWLEQAMSNLWRGEEIGEKAGAAFCTTGTAHGGNEATIYTMLTALMHMGCVITPAGYLYPTLRRNQMPYGASAVTGPDADIPPTSEDLAAARALGFRVSHVARSLLAGRSQEDFRRHFQQWGAPRPPDFR